MKTNDTWICGLYILYKLREVRNLISDHRKMRLCEHSKFYSLLFLKCFPRDSNGWSPVSHAKYKRKSLSYFKPRPLSLKSVNYVSIDIKVNKYTSGFICFIVYKLNKVISYFIRFFKYPTNNTTFFCNRNI